jgi:hypothetical protein
MNCVADPLAEDGSESDEAPAKVRKCTGRRSEDWKILTETEGTHETAQEALTDILQMQSETVGFAQHPYQRAKLDRGPTYGIVICKPIKTIIFSSSHKIFLEKNIVFFCSGNFEAVRRKLLR